MSYTANDALNELDKFPGFKAELADLLTLGETLHGYPDDYQLAGKIAKQARRLGAMINLRASQDTGEAA